MVAKNKKKRRPTGFDMQFAAHIRASASANAWAGKCLHYREVGTSALAKAAERRAKYWLRKMLAIATRALATYGKLSVGSLVTKYFASPQRARRHELGKPGKPHVPLRPLPNTSKVFIEIRTRAGARGAHWPY